MALTCLKEAVCDRTVGDEMLWPTVCTSLLMQLGFDLLHFVLQV